MQPAADRRLPLPRRRRTTTRTPTSGCPPCSTSSTRDRGTGGNRVFYLSTPPEAFEPIVTGLGGAGLAGAARRPGGDREAVRDRRADRGAARRDRARALRRAAGLPDRPLPRQGHRAERAGAALRQRGLRADLEPHLGRPRADHGGRDARRRHPRQLLRERRRDPGHPAEPRAAGAGAGPDGAADLVLRRGGAQREGQAAAVDPAADRDRTSTGSRCAGSTPAAAPGTS